jgi:hypothetical protein
MPTPSLNLRQSQIDEVASLIFTEPVQARARCYALLDEARLAFDMPTFVQAATQLSLIEDQLGDLPAAINVLSEAFAYAQEFRLFQSSQRYWSNLAVAIIRSHTMRRRSKLGSNAFYCVASSRSYKRPALWPLSVWGGFAMWPMSISARC